jgi:hypothetical protein
MMKWLMRVCLLLVLVECTASPAWAYRRDFRIPLLGCHEYFYASGTARYVAKLNEAKVTRYEEVTVEVKNVPLKPGTVLVVEIDDETIGNITLDARQSGILTVTTETRKYIPFIKAGSNVSIRKVDGSVVLR